MASCHSRLLPQNLDQKMGAIAPGAYGEAYLVWE